MLPKRPSRPAQPHPQLQSHLPTQTANPTSQALPAGTTIVRLSEPFRKRRSLVWAVGTAVIVIAGVYIGAQYKEARQVQERLEKKAVPLHKEQESEGAARSSADVEAKETVNSGVLKPKQDTTMRGTSYDQRQISFLEDRRGALMKQRFDLERKIERVREKMKREEEVEARRGGDIVGHGPK